MMLPEGYTLDAPAPQKAVGLPAGYTLDAPTDENQGFIPALKRGMSAANIGIHQFLNAGDMAIQKNLPKGVADALTYEVGSGTPSPAELQRRKDVYENAAQDVQKQGKGTGFTGWAGETLGNPLTYTPGKGLVGQGLAYGTADAFLGPKTEDTGLGGRAEEAAWKAPLSAATSLAVGKATGKLLGPAAKLPPAEQAAADAAEQAGLKLTPGQKTDSLMLKGMDSLLSTEGTSAKDFTKLAFQKTGIDSSTVSPEVLNKGFETIGSKIGDITKPYNIPVTSDLMSKFKGVVSAKLNNGEASRISAWVDDILKGTEKADDATVEAAKDALLRHGPGPLHYKQVIPQVIPGSHYQSMYSQIGDAMRAAYKSGNSEYGAALKDLRSTLSEAMMQTMPKEEAAKLLAERQKYANLLTIEQAWKPAKGNTISPRDLAGAMGSQNQKLFKRGYGQLNNLAQSGLEFMPKSAMGKYKTKAAEVGGAALYGFHLGGPVGALTGAAAGAAAPYVGRPIYQSKIVSDYLTKGVQSVSPRAREIAKALAGRGANVLTQ